MDKLERGSVMKNQEINLEKAKLFLWEAIDSLKEHKRKEWDDDMDLIDALGYIENTLMNLGDTKVSKDCIRVD